MGLTVVSAPASEPVTTAEVKSHLGIPSAETGHDTRLSHLITAARTMAERYTGKAFITQTLKLTMDYFPKWRIYLPRPPLVSVSSITYLDEDDVTQTLSSSLYDVFTDSSPGFVEPAYGETWPTPRVESQTVDITYVCGSGAASTDVPSDVREAMILMVEWWFDGHSLNGKMNPAAKAILESAQCGAKFGFYGVTK